MSKRLQVLLDDAELTEIREVARRRQMTVAEWVRQTLRSARRRAPEGDAQKKLSAVRAAAANRFPSGTIDEMLAEIEHGYTGPVS